MPNKKRLFRISFLLLFVNLVLVGTIFFNQISSGFNFDKLKNTNQNSEVKGATSLPTFEPSKVLTENDFRSTRVFPSENSVQAYLQASNSPLKNYSDQGKSASYWIFAASRGISSSKWNIKPNINPAVIITFLEKEQSLISLSGYNTAKDPENRIVNAMGYGCPDDGICDPQYAGLANQINWAAYQLEYNIYVATNPSSIDLFKVNSTITTLDNFDVFLSNSVTASMYRYTPHVYWGNFNVWLIMTSNGWGESAQTYNFVDLRSYNLANKSNLIGDQYDQVVKIDQIRSLLINPPSIGTTGANIELLQKFLKQEGYFVYPTITGYYGTITDTALKNYVKEKGTGASSSPAEDTECVSLYKKTWQIGDENDEVKKLQGCLRKLGLFDWPSDTGYFGNVTNEALNKYKNGSNSTSNSKSTTTQPTSPCDILKTKGFKIGDENDEIKSLQSCLRKEGLFDWPTDTGYFGPVTNKSLAQSLDNLNKTWTCSELKTQAFFEIQTSDRVRQLQACMRQSSHFTWANGDTGYFGPVTKDSIIKWRGYV